MLRNASLRAKHYTRHVFQCYGFQLLGAAERTCTLNARVPISNPYRTSCHKSLYHAPERQSLSFESDTVYAISTAAGRAGIAIVRISGPSCLDVRYIDVLSYLVLI